MTLIRDREIECGVCHKKSSHPMLMSTNSMGYPDLDLRPPEMQRSTMNTWILECPHCGYVAGRLDEEPEITANFLKTERYITCDGIEFEGKLSKRFYRRYLISNELNNTEGCFFNLLHCAWDCDDENDRENAVRVRKLAVGYLDRMIETDSEKKNDYIVMKADLLRRSGEFEKLISEYEGVVLDEEIHDKILTFQIIKAKLGDGECYTVEDVVKP